MLKQKFLFIIISVLLLFVSANVAALEIYIPAEVDIKGEEIRLGEIARISGKGEELIKEIKSIEIAKSPLPGYSKRLSRELVRLVLKNKGYEVENIKLDIPRVFTVNTKSKKISIEKLINFARKYIEKNISFSEQQLEIEINSSLSEVLIPDTDYLLKINDEKEIKPGNNSLLVKIEINSQEYKRVYLTAEVNIIRNVYVANRDLEQGLGVKREDFRIEQRKINREIGSLVTEWNKDFLKNRILASSMRKGEILEKGILEKPFVINWGDKVQALIKIGSVKVSTVVSARERGKIGDYITVENPKTRHKFNAKVVNSRLVMIENKREE